MNYQNVRIQHYSTEKEIKVNLGNLLMIKFKSRLLIHNRLLFFIYPKKKPRKKALRGFLIQSNGIYCSSTK